MCVCCFKKHLPAQVGTNRINSTLLNRAFCLHFYCHKYRLTLVVFTSAFDTECLYNTGSDMQTNSIVSFALPHQQILADLD